MLPSCAHGYLIVITLEKNTAEEDLSEEDRDENIPGNYYACGAMSEDDALDRLHNTCPIEVLDDNEKPVYLGLPLVKKGES